MTHFIGDTLRRTLRWMGGVIVSSALVSLMACSSEEEGPVVQLGPSSIVGLSSAAGVEAFLGLPFAEPPLHDLRWEPPIPWVPSEQVVDATQFLGVRRVVRLDLALQRALQARLLALLGLHLSRGPPPARGKPLPVPVAPC